MRDIEEAGAAADAERGDDALDVFGDFDKLGAARGFYGDGLHVGLGKK